jgi:hypothetical protein
VAPSLHDGRPGVERAELSTGGAGAVRKWGRSPPSLAPMWVTGREAARLLAGVVPTREHARLLLRAGFAGPGTRTSAAVLYDEGALIALASRPLVDVDAVRSTCPHGLHVARMSRRMPLDLTQPWNVISEQVARQPAMPALTRALCAARIAHYGHVGWVATLFGFVSICADATWGP